MKLSHKLHPFFVQLGLLLFLSIPLLSLADDTATSTFVGSETCNECHKAAYEEWKDSHHSWAWRKPAKENVIGKFDGSKVTTNGVTTELYQKDEKFYFKSDGPKGVADFEVKEVAGVSPLQQYILETEEGRFQSHDVVWDDERKKWYHLYPEETVKAGDGLHWTGPYKNWNSRCAVCHATDFKASYDPKERKYHSTQSEIGVGCEACHGPGKNHLEWAKSAETEEKKSSIGKGFSFQYDLADPQKEINNCAPCHSRREPLTDASAPVGAPFTDYYRLALLRDGLYHADGQILDEVYVYGSFLQSKMHQKGVRCTDCHNSHSGTLKAEGDAVCLQCHNPSGNPRFQSLQKKDYQSKAHHFHKEGSKEAQCVNCHMTGRHYMGIDFRRDHSFRIPRPDLSVSSGTPNACTECHGDKTNSWAADEVKKRYPEGSWKKDHYGKVFAKARGGTSPEVIPELVTVAKDTTLPDIVRATALDYLGQNGGSEAIANKVSSLLEDSSPLVRAETAFLQHTTQDSVKIERLLPLTRDVSKIVRLSVAKALLQLSPESLSPEQRADVQRVIREMIQSLSSKADYPEAHMVLGGVAMTLKNFRAVDAAFYEATNLDPQLIRAWATRARVFAALGDAEKAAQILKEGLTKNVDDPTLSQMLSELRGAQ